MSLKNQGPTQIKKSFNIDKVLLFILLLMAACSLIAIYCAIPLAKNSAMGWDNFTKQCLWYAIGFCLLFALLSLGIDRLFTGVRVFYWILLGALFLLLIDKFIFDLPLIRPVSGTTAWFQFPGLGSFQPSEFMKIVLILLIANVIDTHNKNKIDQTFASDIKLFIEVGKYAILPLVLIIAQPDTGIPLIIIVSILVMLIVSGIRKEWIIYGSIFAILLVATILFLFYFYPTILGKLLGDSYKLNRFYGWLNTENYIRSYGNQLYTALLAMGSAGWNGHALQQLVIPLSEAHTDFIFAVIGQNFGFIGSAFVVSLCACFDLKLISIALKYEGTRERIMVAGLLGMLIFQQVENMGMITGLFPITGITLPLISYGGSSMLSYMIPLAVIFYMHSENKSRLKH